MNNIIDISIPLNNYSTKDQCLYVRTLPIKTSYTDDIIKLIKQLREGVKYPGIVIMHKNIINGSFTSQQDLDTFEEILFVYKLRIHNDI